MHYLIRSVFISTLLLCSLHGVAEPLKVAFINPGHPAGDQTGNFWSRVSLFMAAAAEDLEIDLRITYARRNHIVMKSLLKDVNELQPDYVIIVNEKGVADEMLLPCIKLDIPIFMLLNDFEPEDMSRLSESQKALIIGSVKPDNYSVGKRLAADLLAFHQNKNKQSPIVFYALRGDYSTPAALDRYAGMLSAIRGDTSVHFIDSTVANWSRTQAYDKTLGMLLRQPLDVIWAANDAMAFGASEAISDSGVGNPVVGGINWEIDEQAFPLDVSYGGHVALGAKALVVLYDYHNKVLSADKMHEVIDIFESGTESRIRLFNQLFHNNELKKIDFRGFSETSSDKKDFTIDNLLSFLEK